LIRHAYFATEHRGKGLGGVLLDHLLQQTKGPILVGTWTAATWAIRFYDKHGFRQVIPAEKDRLLPIHWSIPERQVETSVVLGNAGWRIALREPSGCGFFLAKPEAVAILLPFMRHIRRSCQRRNSSPQGDTLRSFFASSQRPSLAKPTSSRFKFHSLDQLAV
jgi:hypothetical protein